MPANGRWDLIRRLKVKGLLVPGFFIFYLFIFASATLVHLHHFLIGAVSLSVKSLFRWTLLFQFVSGTFGK